jgi:hypothetical protein
MCRRAGPSSLVAAVACASAAGSAAAHHSVLAYDNEHGTEIAGRVEQLSFANPHTIIVVAVERDDGGRERWTVESESAVELTRLGWQPGMIETGDRIRVLGARAKDGSTALRCRNLYLEDGRELLCFPLKL